MPNHDFEIVKKKRWPWPVGIAAVAIIAAAVWHFSAGQQQTVQFGSTLKVHFEPAMAGE